MIDGKSWPGRSALCVVGLLASMRLCAAEAEEEKATDDGWTYKVQAYGWLPTIDSTLPTGDEFKLEIEDILDYLEFTFMGGFKASKGNWSFVSDVVYLKLSEDKAGSSTLPVGPLNIPTRVDFGADMETWIVNLVGAYSVHRTETSDFQILAGTRYFWLDLDAELDVSLLPGQALVEGSDDVLDAIVGFRGAMELSDKWWFNYRLDAGAGGSDFTWNGAVQFGRRYDWGSLAFGYRYLHHDFDSDFKLLKDLDVYGPLIGAVWEF